MEKVDLKRKLKAQDGEARKRMMNMITEVNPDARSTVNLLAIDRFLAVDSEPLHEDAEEQIIGWLMGEYVISNNTGTVIRLQEEPAEVVKLNKDLQIQIEGMPEEERLRRYGDPSGLKTGERDVRSAVANGAFKTIPPTRKVADAYKEADAIRNGDIPNPKPKPKRDPKPAKKRKTLSLISAVAGGLG